MVSNREVRKEVYSLSKDERLQYFRKKLGSSSLKPEDRKVYETEAENYVVKSHGGNVPLTRTHFIAMATDLDDLGMSNQATKYAKKGVGGIKRLSFVSKALRAHTYGEFIGGDSVKVFDVYDQAIKDGLEKLKKMKKDSPRYTELKSDVELCLKEVREKTRPGRDYLNGIEQELKSLEHSRSKASGKTLEHTLGIITGIGSIAGLFFLSSNITGNVIGSLNQTSSNWIGGILFILGLVGTFAYFRKRK